MKVLLFIYNSNSYNINIFFDIYALICTCILKWVQVQEWQFVENDAYMLYRYLYQEFIDTIDIWIHNPIIH